MWISLPLRGPAFDEVPNGIERCHDDHKLPSGEVQQGLWRLRIEDVLRGQPGLAETLRDQITETRSRLG